MSLLTPLVISLVLTWTVPSVAIGISDIKADDVNFDLSAGEFSATGNVQIDTDELSLSADKVQAKIKGTQLLSIDANGNPLQLDLVLDSEEDEPKKISATAKRLRFHNEENWVEFVGNAHLQTDEANIRAENIRIDLDSQKIVATKGENEDQVEITLRDEETP